MLHECFFDDGLRFDPGMQGKSVMPCVRSLVFDVDFSFETGEHLVAQFPMLEKLFIFTFGDDQAAFTALCRNLSDHGSTSQLRHLWLKDYLFNVDGEDAGPPEVRGLRLLFSGTPRLETLFLERGRVWLPTRPWNECLDAYLQAFSRK